MYMYIYIERNGKIFLKKHTILIQFIYIVSFARAIVCETQFSVGNVRRIKPIIPRRLPPVNYGCSPSPL